MDNEYKTWLREKVDPWLSPHHDVLFDTAFEFEFWYFIPNDANRALDGESLRTAYEAETSNTAPLEMEQFAPCRMLELLVALAIRMNELTYDWTNPDQVVFWFWILIENLKIDDFLIVPKSESKIPSQSLSDYKIEREGDEKPLEKAQICATFEKVCARTYNESGTDGSLFPIKIGVKDQREVEIWYQMMEFLRYFV